MNEKGRERERDGRVAKGDQSFQRSILYVEGRRRDEMEGGMRPILGEAGEMVSQVTRLT